MRQPLFTALTRPLAALTALGFFSLFLLSACWSSAEVSSLPAQQPTTNWVECLDSDLDAEGNLEQLVAIGWPSLPMALEVRGWLQHLPRVDALSPQRLANLYSRGPPRS